MSIFTLTINPAFDVHIYVENFRQGKENYAKSKTRFAGGKGVNVSRALCACGVKNTVLVLIGEESRAEFEAALLFDGVEFSAEYVKGAVRENITVHSGAEETRISFEAEEISECDIDRLFCRAEALSSNGDFIVFAGRIPRGLDAGKIADRLAALSEKGARVCLDSNSFSIENIRKIKPFLIKPNEYELSVLAGFEVVTPSDAARAGEVLVRSGAEHVLASLGEKGAVLITKESRLYAKAPKVNAVSTIGAGDSANAGFIAEKSRGGDDAEALSLAVAMGCAKCEREGTLPPRPDAAERLRKLITIENI